MDSDILVAKHSFSIGVRSVNKGETFRKGHPVVEGREELFEPFVIDNELEQATAAPGEKRGRKKAKAKAKGSKQTGSPADGGTSNYSDLKQPQLKQLLDERGIDYPKGPVANAKLIELLEADDKKSA